MQLPSMALDSGIHARMTGLKIVASNKKYLPEIINTFTISKAIELHLLLFYSCCKKSIITAP